MRNKFKSIKSEENLKRLLLLGNLSPRMTSSAKQFREQQVTEEAPQRKEVNISLIW